MVGGISNAVRAREARKPLNLRPMEPKGTEVDERVLRENGGVSNSKRVDE